MTASLGLMGGVSLFLRWRTGDGDLTATFGLTFLDLSRVADLDVDLVFFSLWPRLSELEELVLFLPFFGRLRFVSCEDELLEVVSSLLLLESEDVELDSLDGLLSFLVFFSFCNKSRRYSAAAIDNDSNYLSGFVLHFHLEF